MVAFRRDGFEDAARERELQEHDVAFSHMLAEAEYALAREGACVGRVLEDAGLAFDAHTFVALRIVESSVAEGVDPVEALTSDHLRVMVERSVDLVAGLLAEDG